MVYSIRGMCDRCPASVEPPSKPLRPARLAWLGLLILAAAGCGQKGPLTLPAASSPFAPAAAASAPGSK